MAKLDVVDVAEQKRLNDAREAGVPWKKWGPYLSERQWGTVREDYIDSTPTHSYMKYLYKYPQREFPYRDLLETNGRRSREEFEYELLDTGAFDDDRYFDVIVEYAKNTAEDI